MRNKVLIIVDMQHDFIDGSLANESAKKIIPSIKKELESGEYSHIIFTRDTHDSNYLSTSEGKHLPVEHCIKDTEGWEINEDLLDTARYYNDSITFLNKPTFGSLELLSHIQSCGNFEEVVFVGTCTDICVISNALILKAMEPNIEISVIADCCAGTNLDRHISALDVMETCQINVIR